MSNYLGFEPVDCSDFYFVSYNNEDAARVGDIAQKLFNDKIPLWYDHGIEYGEKWETKISSKLANCKAVILFFTKGILQKENSYVRKEYTMATEYFGKKVYVVIMDAIEKREIPFDKVPWWIDIQEKQCINVIGITDAAEINEKIKEALGIFTPTASISSSQEKLICDVVLHAVGPNKLNVIKEIREITGLGLAKAKDVAEAAPIIVLTGADIERAKNAVSRLNSVGATAMLE